MELGEKNLQNEKDELESTIRRYRKTLYKIHIALVLMKDSIRAMTNTNGTYYYTHKLKDGAIHLLVDQIEAINRWAVETGTYKSLEEDIPF